MHEPLSKPGLRAKFHYCFDNLMSAGTGAVIAALGIICLLIVFTAGIVILSLNIKQSSGEAFTFGEAAWQSMLRTLDAGTMGDDTGWGLRIVMILVTLGGIFVVSAFIGVIANAFQEKLHNLRKGRSFVLEKNHTVIVGWSPKIFTILSELIIANLNQRKAHIVILAEQDKVFMDEEIRSRIQKFHNTKIICRSGSTTDMSDLHIANINQAKSIIVIPSEESNSDISVMRTLLAITNNPSRKKEPYNIITELKEEKNQLAAKLIGKEEVSVILSPQIISEIAVQTCLQSGLSIVYNEFLDFDNDEIYFTPEPKLVGKTFAEAIHSYKKSSPIGLRLKNGEVRLKPAFETIIQEGDEIIAISADDDTIEIHDEKIEIMESTIEKNDNQSEIKPENVLILGWNQNIIKILEELEKTIGQRSSVHIVDEDENIHKNVIGLKHQFKHLRLTFEQGDVTDYGVLEAIPFEEYDHVMILSSENHKGNEKDAKSIITLVYTRKITESRNHSPNIVTEMLDVRNMELAQVTKADDFIISNKLISLMLSQLSENKNLKLVFNELFGAEKIRISLKPAYRYIVPEVKTNFATVVEAAKRKKEIAIGYRLNQFASSVEKSYGIHLNPDKSNPINFKTEDKIIVIA